MIIPITARVTQVMFVSRKWPVQKRPDIYETETPKKLICQIRIDSGQIKNAIKNYVTSCLNVYVCLTLV